MHHHHLKHWTIYAALEKVISALRTLILELVYVTRRRKAHIEKAFTAFPSHPTLLDQGLQQRNWLDELSLATQRQYTL